MDLSLKNKRAIVCGSSQGIGRAIAIKLSRLGCEIILLARNERKLKDTLDKLSYDKNQNHKYIIVDFTKPSLLIEKIKKELEFIPVHILVNNTGGPSAGNIFEAKPNEFLDAFQQHLICNQYLAQFVIPIMKIKKYGRIINIISTSVKVPLNGLGVSNTIRGAVANWSKTLANEVGKYNITVNNILPGATKTTRLETIIANKSMKLNKSEDEIIKEMISEIPMQRFAEPEEIANAVAFIASSSASYINGVNIPIDGGRTPCL